MSKCRLSALALGLSFGTLWGSVVLLIGLFAHFANYGTTFVTSMGVFYVGYGPSIIGSIVGGIIGFLDAFIGGFIIAWLYNLYAHCGCKKADEVEGAKE